MKRSPGLFILLILFALAGGCHVGTYEPPDAPPPADAAAKLDAGAAKADAGPAVADAMHKD
jgi:hypothetical protein